MRKLMSLFARYGLPSQLNGPQFTAVEFEECANDIKCLKSAPYT